MTQNLLTTTTKVGEIYELPTLNAGPMLVTVEPPGGSRSTVRILELGDSHTMGVLHGAVVSGTEVVGPSSLSSTKDEMWTAAGVSPVCYSNSGIGRFSGVPPHLNTDGNLGVTNSGSFVNWVPGILRASYPHLFDRIRYCNYGMGGACSYSWSGNSATAYIGVQAPANAGDTITINGRVYTFRAVPAVADEIAIGGTVNAQAVNIFHALNADGTAGAYGPGTTINADVFCTNVPGGFLLPMTARQIGALGNANVMASSAGAGTRVYIYQQFANGDDYSNLLYLCQQDMATGGGFGTPDVITLLLGTNDASRLGWNAINYQTHMAALLARLRADYPATPVVMWQPPATGGVSSNALITGTIMPANVALAAAHDWVTLIDANVLANTAGTTTAIISADGVHLTVLGYNYAAQLLAKGIAQALGL